MRQVTTIVLVMGLLCASGCARHRTIELQTVHAGAKLIENTPLAIHVQERVRRRDVKFIGLAGAGDTKHRGLRVGIVNSYTSLTISQGWLYLRGMYPYARGRLVEGGATDATFIIVSNPSQDIVIFLCTEKNAELRVSSLQGSRQNTVVLPNPGTFVIATENNGEVQFTPVRPIDSDQAILKLVDDTRQAVETATNSVPDLEWCGPTGTPAPPPPSPT